MPILKRIITEPEHRKDYRNTKGVHFEAKCDYCGEIFYPKRSTAKYCSKTCGREAVRIANQDKKSIKGTRQEISEAIKALEILKEGEIDQSKIFELNKQIRALKIALKHTNA
jgi:hypothetical protein